MPVYHFKLHDGSDFPDRDGIALPDFQAARRQVLQLAGELLRDQARKLLERRGLEGRGARRREPGPVHDAARGLRRARDRAAIAYGLGGAGACRAVMAAESG